MDTSITSLQCTYSIPCDCDSCDINKTGRTLEVCIKEYRYNLEQGLWEKSKLAQYVGYKLRFYRLNVTSTGNTRNQSTCLLVAIPISQPNLDISPIWTPTIEEEADKLQFHPV
jgi:hypothetical protein